MTAAEITFWVPAALLAYTYVGYPALLALACLLKRPPRVPETQDWPSLTVLVVAYNEEEQIERKLRNILAAEYPDDRLEVVVCSDGSTDGTNALVEAFDDPRVKLAATTENRGVNEAFGNGARMATGELLLMTDSGGLFEPGAFKTAIAHFADPTVGCVNGLFDHANPEGRTMATGYRGYWAIETTVRLLETRLGLGCVIVGAFEVIRRTLYRPLPSDVNNDMLVPMEVTAQGYRVVYEPRAVVRAVQKKRGKQEFNRRLRVAVRGWSSLPTLLRAVPPWKTPLNWVAQFSHKYLRWLTGFLLIGLLVSNALLWREPVYRWFLVAQGVFYAVAIVGYVASLFIARLPKVLAMPYWFCLVQAAGLVGLIQSVAGRRVATWKPEP